MSFDSRFELEENNSRIVLNHTGKEVLAELKRGYTLGKISDDISERYGISKKQARFDVLDFAGNLVAYGIATLN
ncbi:PqqD family protein [Oceanithermus sp.]